MQIHQWAIILAPLFSKHKIVKKVLFLQIEKNGPGEQGNLILDGEAKINWKALKVCVNNLPKSTSRATRKEQIIISSAHIQILEKNKIN